MREEVREAIMMEKLMMLGANGVDFRAEAWCGPGMAGPQHFSQCRDHKEKNIVRNIISAKNPEDMPINLHRLRSVARM
eukprot:SAG22_NODE_10923_length_509_cov_1.336585_2_plen_78_part_01